MKISISKASQRLGSCWQDRSRAHPWRPPSLRPGQTARGSAAQGACGTCNPGPDQFASAGMFGSGVINGENQQVADWLAATNAENRPRVFINVGEQDPFMLEQAEVMTAILDQAGVPYEFIVGEGAHTYEYWSTNLAQYFRWVAEDW